MYGEEHYDDDAAQSSSTEWFDGMCDIEYGDDDHHEHSDGDAAPLCPAFFDNAL